MDEDLLTIIESFIAVCLLGVGATVLAFGEIICENLANRIERRRYRRTGIKPPPRIDGVHLTDWEDYLDWANRTGRWTEQDHKLEERDRRARIWLDQQLGRRGEGL
jgi:hypothetical protein